MFAESRLEASQKLNQRFHTDIHWCEAAIKMGYDSLQIVHKHNPQNFITEIAFCTGGCYSKPVGSACPPIELKTGINADKKCNCNSKIPILNCGNDIAPIGACEAHQSVKQVGHRQSCTVLVDRKVPNSPEINRSYELSIIVSSNIRVYSAEMTNAITELHVTEMKIMKNVFLVDVERAFTKAFKTPSTV